MNAPTDHDDDDNQMKKNVEQESMTHPPLLDKHSPFDMFSAADINPTDETNGKGSLSPKPVDDVSMLSSDDVRYQTPKKIEPVLGKERAIKILKAFGSKPKTVKEFHTNVLKTPTKDSSNNKLKREKKTLTPLEKAKETISQIEELKKFKDRTIPTYFGENVVIHHIKVETKPEPNKSEHSDRVDKVVGDRDRDDIAYGPKTPVDSLEALKVYNNVDVDKQSDEDVSSDRDAHTASLCNDLLDVSALERKVKRTKEKRSRRISLDIRSSDRKRKRRNKDRKKKKSKDSSSSRRSSTNSVRKRSKKKRDSNRDKE